MRLRSILIFSFLSLFLTAFGGHAFAQTKSDTVIPDTTAGRVFFDFLRAYNTGDEVELRRFFDVHSAQTEADKRRESVNRRAAWVANIYKGYRELEIQGIKRSTEREIVVLCRSKITEAWCEFEFEVDAEPPHGVAIGFTYAARPPGKAFRGKLTQKEIIKELDAYLEKLIRAEMFSGTVLIARDGKPVFKKSYGWENESAEIPNRAGTKFSLASMSKMFTAVAIAQLAQRGRLSFDDTIGRHLPEYPNRQAAEKITIHHLLTHTSGLGDYMNKERFHTARKNAGGRFDSPKDYFPFFAGDDPLFEPGERFEYTSAGYIVLGAIIEKVSGESYFDYVSKHIFKPAGMKNTDPRGKTGSPAGSAVSTAEDLLKFSRALLGHKLLSARYVDILLAPKTDSAFGKSYAYGFFVRKSEGAGRIVGHDGESTGVNTQFDIYLG